MTLGMTIYSYFLFVTPVADRSLNSIAQRSLLTVHSFLDVFLRQLVKHLKVKLEVTKYKVN